MLLLIINNCYYCCCCCYAKIVVPYIVHSIYPIMPWEKLCTTKRCVPACFAVTHKKRLMTGGDPVWETDAHLESTMSQSDGFLRPRGRGNPSAHMITERHLCKQTHFKEKHTKARSNHLEFPDLLLRPQQLDRRVSASTKPSR